jgi:hypothetical protein
VNDAQEQDRLAARGLDVTVPARMNRAFLGRVVHFLAAERGIRPNTSAVIPGLPWGWRCR